MRRHYTRAALWHPNEHVSRETQKKVFEANKAQRVLQLYLKDTHKPNFYKTEIPTPTRRAPLRATHSDPHFGTLRYLPVTASNNPFDYQHGKLLMCVTWLALMPHAPNLVQNTSRKIFWTHKRTCHEKQGCRIVPSKIEHALSQNSLKRLSKFDRTKTNTKWWPTLCLLVTGTSLDRVCTN